MKDLVAAVKNALEKRKRVLVKNPRNLVLDGVPGEVIELGNKEKGYIPPANSTLAFLGKVKNKGYYHGHGYTDTTRYYHLSMGDGKELFIKFAGSYAQAVKSEDIPQVIFEGFLSNKLGKLKKAIGF